MKRGNDGKNRTSPLTNSHIYWWTILFVAAGVGVLYLLSTHIVPYHWREAGFTIAGALLGQVGLSLDELLRAAPEREKHERERAEDQRHIEETENTNRELIEAKRRDDLRRKNDALTAFSIGLLATSLPSLDAQTAQYDLGCLLNLCLDIGLRFDKEEYNKFDGVSLNASDLANVTSLVTARAKKDLGRLWCFFELGNRRQWLFRQIESRKSAGEVLAWLEPFSENPHLQEVPQLAQTVGKLVETLLPYKSSIPNEERKDLEIGVRGLFHEFTMGYIQGRNTLVRLQPSPWFWVAEGFLVCHVADIPGMPGHEFRVAIYDVNTYDVQGTENGANLDTARVVRDAAGWHCSAHNDADMKEPCFDLQLVLGVTDGGEPPVNESGELVGKVILVRSDENVEAA